MLIDRHTQSRDYPDQINLDDFVGFGGLTADPNSQTLKRVHYSGKEGFYTRYYTHNSCETIVIPYETVDLNDETNWDNQNDLSDSLYCQIIFNL